MSYQHIRLDEPVGYTVKVQGRLRTDFHDWFVGEVQQVSERFDSGETMTVLTGTVLDQAALHGLLAQIRDMGLTLLLVRCLQLDDTNG